jgi:glycosyltransferase involved in cell wall biosynthesis
MSAPAATPARAIRVLHVITRMIVGGAQENTLLSCALIDRARFPSEILSGVETGAEGSLHATCMARGVTLRFEPALVRNLHPLSDAIALFRLWRRFRRERWDVVHVHTSKAGILGRMAARLAGVPVVIHTAHGWAFSRDQSPPVYALYVFLERLCAKLCDAIVVVCEPDRDEALRLGVGRREQYVLIRSGIEIEAFRDVTVSRAEARRRLAIPADAFVVGTVGRLTAQKAPLDLLAAFERVAAAEPRAHLVFVGDGPLRLKVVAAARASGLGERVHLAGLRHDVPEMFRAFDAFALSSRWEGLPRVFPQAMAAGLPIVATDVVGARDAVRDGENGWRVPVGDAAALAERLLALAGDPALARRMGEAGRAAVDEFSARRMVQQLEQLYARLVAARAAR